jgi:hypothetical protein
MTTSKPARALVAGAALACGACGLFFDVDSLGRGGADADASPDATTAAPPGGGDGGGDAHTEGARATGDGPNTPDAPVDAPASDGVGPTGLDDGVVLPDLDAAVCNPFGSPFQCGANTTCRMATPDAGRCEGCDAGCAGGVKSACTRTIDCDSQLQCFRSTCTTTCILGSVECGRLADCIDVGFAGYGLCNPSAL